MKTHYEWLIERGQPEGEEQTVYHEHSLQHHAPEGCWTTDANKANMFSSREDAEAYITEHGLTARAVEHGFLTETHDGGTATRDDLAFEHRLAEAFIEYVELFMLDDDDTYAMVDRISTALYSSAQEIDRG